MGKEGCRMIDIWFLSAFILMLWLILSLLRAILGPTAPDRVVALDTINTLIVALMIILAVAYNQIIYVDIAIVYALLSFVTTLYIAKYLEGGI